MSENEFAEWLKNELREKEWDALDLAIETGVSKQIIQYYLRGQRTPTYKTLQLILQAFDKHMVFVEN